MEVLRLVNKFDKHIYSHEKKGGGVSALHLDQVYGLTSYSGALSGAHVKKRSIQLCRIAMCVKYTQTNAVPKQKSMLSC